MLSLKIKEVLKFNEYVVEGENIQTSIVLEINGINKGLSVGDNLLIHENLLNKNSKYYTMPISFEITKEKLAKDIKEDNDKEYGVVKINEKLFILKRVYG